MAFSVINFVSSLDTCLTIFPGEPTTKELSGITLFSVTSALAPMIQFFPIFAPFKMTAPIPIKELSSMVHPCSITKCPMVTSLPIFNG